MLLAVQKDWRALLRNNNVITIPADSIDISGESKDVEKKISLNNLLPDNVKLTSDSSEDVWVTVNILPVGSKEFDIPTKNIEVKNKPDDLQVTFETAQIELESSQIRRIWMIWMRRKI